MKRKKKFLAWLAALGVATILIYPKEVYDALMALKKELERERKELSKEQ